MKRIWDINTVFSTSFVQNYKSAGKLVFAKFICLQQPRGSPRGGATCSRVPFKIFALFPCSLPKFNHAPLFPFINEILFRYSENLTVYLAFDSLPRDILALSNFSRLFNRHRINTFNHSRKRLFRWPQSDKT